MDLVRMTHKELTSHLRPPADHDFESDEWTRLTLDRKQAWWRVSCPNGHLHLIAWDGRSTTTFECGVHDQKNPRKSCDGAKYTVDIGEEGNA